MARIGTETSFFEHSLVLFVSSEIYFRTLDVVTSNAMKGGKMHLNIFVEGLAMVTTDDIHWRICFYTLFFC